MKKRIKKNLAKKVSRYYYLPSIIPDLYSYHSLVKYAQYYNHERKNHVLLKTPNNYARVHNMTALSYQEYYLARFDKMLSERLNVEWYKHRRNM